MIPLEGKIKESGRSAGGREKWGMQSRGWGGKSINLKDCSPRG